LDDNAKSNVTTIEELTGNFNSITENQMLIVLNELKNCGDDRLANFDSLKSLITDAPLRINEKNQPRRDAQNVANFIFATNNSFPVKKEASDRRYLVLACSGDRVGEHEYFKNLVDTFADEFYSNLLTFFMIMDLSDFDTRKIPVTEAKQDLIEASRPVIDSWIMEHYDELILGLNCSEALRMKPNELKDKSFQLQLKDKCERVRKQGEWRYVLKNEAKKLFHQIDLNE
jgi:hypothetical protein